MRRHLRKLTKAAAILLSFVLLAGNLQGAFAGSAMVYAAELSASEADAGELNLPDQNGDAEDAVSAADGLTGDGHTAPENGDITGTEEDAAAGADEAGGAENGTGEGADEGIGTDEGTGEGTENVPATEDETEAGVENDADENSEDAGAETGSDAEEEVIEEEDEERESSDAMNANVHVFPGKEEEPVMQYGSVMSVVAFIFR